MFRRYAERLVQDSQEAWKPYFVATLAFIFEIEEATFADTATNIYQACLAAGLIEQQQVHHRLASITHGLGEDYCGAFDLAEFRKRIDETFRWHESDHNRFVSPSFALVQSSGMGKTKLLQQYKKSQHGRQNFGVVMLLCHDGKDKGALIPKDYKKHFDGLLSVPTTKDPHAIHTSLQQQYLENTNCQDVVFLMDEAQKLTNASDGGWYDAVRWWLRLARRENVVAVFAGSQLFSLTHYHHVRLSVGSSREPMARYVNYTIQGDNGTEKRKTYDPFFTLTTMAMEHVMKKNNKEAFLKRNHVPSNTNDDLYYDVLYDIRSCGYFGRPLFASLLRARKEEDVDCLTLDPRFAVEKAEEGVTVIHNTILRRALSRILLCWTGPSWECEPPALASVLATRVQMGIPSYALAERATSDGYATLVGFRGTSSSGVSSTNNEHRNEFGAASIAFLPDPVCSALAMGLMRKSWSVASSAGTLPIRGQPGKFWVEKAVLVFEQGLFLPNRGDAAEVFAALYMLLCGDEIRARKDAFMRKFEIGLEDWYTSLLCCDESNETEPKPSIDHSEAPPQKRRRKSLRIAEMTMDQQKRMEGSKSIPLDVNTKCSLNFIQICQNHFRTHAWFKQAALEFMYDTASGCYVHANCPAIDIVFPVKVINPNNASNTRYHPVLVSVNCWDTMKCANMQEALNAMKKYLDEFRDDKEKETAALCLLIVIGSRSVGKLPNVEGSFPSNDTFVPIIVPASDKFGVNKAIVACASSLARAEILMSHPYAHVEDQCYNPLGSNMSSKDETFGNNLLSDKRSLRPQIDTEETMGES